MKSLYLLRHAKSSWDNPGLSDIDRPLNPRGERDAPRMGKALGARLQPMMFHVSPAERAQSTFRNLQLHWPDLTAEHGVTGLRTVAELAVITLSVDRCVYDVVGRLVARVLRAIHIVGQ